MSDQYSLSSFAGAYDVYGPSYGFPLVFLHADALRGFTQADMYHSYHYGYQGNKEADERQQYYVEFEEPQPQPGEEDPKE